MNKQVINLSLLLLISIFCSCNNPLHRHYSPATYEEDMQAIRNSDKLTDDELQAIAGYVLLARLSRKDITGERYDDIIEKIRSLRKNNEELSSRDVATKEARRKRLAPFLEVDLQDKTFSKKDNKDVLVFTISLKNTSSKKIKTVTGNLSITDLLEKPIHSLNVLLDEDISPGQTIIQTYNIDYNDADENDRRIRSKDIFDIKPIWNPEKIIFANGTLAE